MPVAAGPHCTSAVDTSFVSLGYAKIAFLGVVQGITELLPISSSAHMRAVPAFLGWPDPGSAFSAAMQLAALAAVVVYFWADIRTVTIDFAQALRGGKRDNAGFRLGASIVLATIPIAIAGLALSHTLNRCGSPLRAPMVVGAACVIMALLMGFAELSARHVRETDKLTYRDALIIGLAQMGALIPGVSRSGSTFTGALFLGFKREDAARVSFLLGIPAIALAGVVELAALRHAGLSVYGWSVLGVGLVVATISAFAAIWGLMRFLQNFSTWPLVIYRALFGLLVMAGAYYHWIS
ncbi:MAG TPA: undecaprenyl-diphosphate phosphatase [Rhizomicrobium sp.]